MSDCTVFDVKGDRFKSQNVYEYVRLQSNKLKDKHLLVQVKLLSIQQLNVLNVISIYRFNMLM